MNKKFLYYLPLLTIVFLGLYFRLVGISTNHSFWGDEAYIGGITKDIFTGKIDFFGGLLALRYQLMQVITEVLSFVLFGASEWSARLPSVVWGSLGILTVFFVVKNIAGYWSGILASFLSAFLQINLANSTQAKPYSAIQTLFLLTILLSQISQNKSKTIFFHVSTIIVASIALLYHPIGIVCFVYYIAHNFDLMRSAFRSHPKKASLLLVIAMIVAVTVFRVDKILLLFFRPQVNNLAHLRELFWRQYGLFVLPGIFGLFMVKDKKFVFSNLVVTIPLIILWSFFQESKNIRYLLPIFTLIVTWFSIFWGRVFGVLFKMPQLALLLIVVLYLGGYKIIRKPAIYYTPNADFFADVQNADFKTFFSLAYDKYPSLDEYPVFTNSFDHGSWYTNQYPAAMFMKKEPIPRMHDYYPTFIYPDLQHFINEQNKYQKGFVVLEDWQSLMPDDIKDYIKKNLNLELRVESLVISPNDKWPLELYSWGLSGH